MVKITHNAIRLVAGMLFWVRHEWVREVLSACCQILFPCNSLTYVMDAANTCHIRPGVRRTRVVFFSFCR